MAIIDVRRMRDAFVRASATDEASGLEMATSLDEELTKTVVTSERLETLEQRIDARFERNEASLDTVATTIRAEMNTRFAQAEADAERRANRHTAILLTALAIAVGVLGILIAVL
jgi:hypothetical protein